MTTRVLVCSVHRRAHPTRGHTRKRGSRILRHCGPWDRPASRAPPLRDAPEQLVLELEYVDTDEFLMAL